ncbi:InlB B-repeat-containing protein [Listeria monocytogenes]|nr:LPXTG cell wall anchor domain-containing protein [Listeria monocytogenes]EAC9042254.1 LPXTG cell wall anchor domain-containing protein [Listeria monocytogenes]EAG2102259.1 LPXTG cell wall anchor domain-containing protein [Listeria monocytogenes]EAK8408285.1 LPXTG cell wall anchor domain-containing protein [Listeria monocytogenes]EHD1634046.1 LPXTG cell wall anchor domain-containing protein [Listeria monocytogenes]
MKNKNLGGLIKSFTRLILIIAIFTCIGESNKLNVQAESIAQPTAINQIFPDPTLAEVMADRLGKASVSDTVSQNELNQLTYLSTFLNNIESIEGLQYLNNLTDLTLLKTQISDISVLSGLTNLTFLNIAGNQISDISILSGLSKLETLTVDDNQISDISVLSKLTNLKSLSFSNNQQISDISVLAGLTNLEALGLYTNEVSDIGVLSNLTNLEYLNLYNNNVSDINALSDLTNLEQLFLDTNQISDISALSKLTKLRNLQLRLNKISDISMLEQLTNLEQLSLSSNQVVDVSPLAGLTNIYNLRLSYNQISDISALSSLINMRYIDLDYQRINKEDIVYNPNIVIPNEIKDASGVLIAPDTISNNGVYTPPNIVWNLPSYLDEVNYTFNQSITIGNATASFNGTVKQPLNILPIPSYRLTFDINGVQSSEDVSEGSLITEPPIPTKEGYTFTGWYDAKTGGNKWDFSVDKMPANDLTLYAQFSINKYTVTFDVDGNVTKEAVDYQGMITEPPIPTKEGYTFTGWYDAKTGGNKWDFSANKMPAEDVILYAQFKTENLPIDDSTNTNNQTNTLPKTGDATSNWLVLGIIFVSIGIVIMGRKKQI